MKILDNLKIKFSALCIVALALFFSGTGLELALAEGGHIGGGGGQQDFTSGTWTDAYQGIRLSLMDKDGNNVLAQANKGYTAIDIHFSDPRQIVGYTMRGNKFEEPRGATQNIKPLSENQFYQLVNKALQDKAGKYGNLNPIDIGKKLPRPIINSGGGRYVGNGLAVKQFFTQGSSAGGVLDGYILPLLDIKDAKTGEFIFGDSTGEVPSEIFREGDTGLVLEPIIWFIPKSQSTGQIANSYYYGTITNFARLMNAGFYRNESAHPSLTAVASVLMHIDTDAVFLNSGEKFAGISINGTHSDGTKLIYNHYCCDKHSF